MSETTILILLLGAGVLLTMLISAAMLLTVAQFAGLRSLITELIALIKGSKDPDEDNTHQ